MAPLALERIPFSPSGNSSTPHCLGCLESHEFSLWSNRLGSQKHTLEDLWPQDLELGVKRQRVACWTSYLLETLLSLHFPPWERPLQMLQDSLLNNLQDQWAQEPIHL